MRTVVLTEHVPSSPVPLSVVQRDALLLVSGLTITPAPGSTGQHRAAPGSTGQHRAAPGSTETYTLTSGSTVGVARVGELTVELRPKIGVAAVLFLVSYALDPKSWKAEQAELAADANLAEAIVPLFARTAQQAIRPGLLHGYRRREDTLTSVRGRVRIAEQFRSRTGLPLPIEVVCDDFTPDILETSSCGPPWTSSGSYTCGIEVRAPGQRSAPAA